MGRWTVFTLEAQHVSGERFRIEHRQFQRGHDRPRRNLLRLEKVLPQPILNGVRLPLIEMREVEIVTRFVSDVTQIRPERAALTSIGVAPEAALLTK